MKFLFIYITIIKTILKFYFLNQKLKFNFFLNIKNKLIKKIIIN